MASALTHTAAVKNAALDAILNRADNGTGTTTGIIKFYTGAAPGAGNSEAGTLLGSVNVAAAPSFAAASAGTKSANGTPLSGSVATSGTPGHYRLVDRDGNVIEEGSVGTSAADMIFANVTWLSGGALSITSYTLTAFA
jgi:hypothetical protein